MSGSKLHTVNRHYESKVMGTWWNEKEKSFSSAYMLTLKLKGNNITMHPIWGHSDAYSDTACLNACPQETFPWFQFSVRYCEFMYVKAWQWCFIWLAGKNYNCFRLLISDSISALIFGCCCVFIGTQLCHNRLLWVDNDQNQSFNDITDWFWISILPSSIDLESNN